MKILENRRVVLGVTGSISAYKAAYLARLLVKAGADARVVMTKAAQRFIGAVTFEAITGNEVLTDKNESWANDNNHIGLAKWAETLIIAPATANTINKIAIGAADNLLLQTVLVCKAPKILAPAANDAMINNEATLAALGVLERERNWSVETEEGELVCKEIGAGRLAEPERLFWAIARSLLRRDFWDKRAVIITGGACREAIDSVRDITNRSSGKMAIALARVAYCLGASPVLIGSANDPALPIAQIEANGADEMLKILNANIAAQQKSSDKKSVLLMAAAVSDYRAKSPSKKKLKKSDIGDRWILELKQTEDILSLIDKSDLFCVGFKAETDAKNAEKYALDMKEEKRLNAVCLNILGLDGVEFGSDRTKIVFLGDDRQEFEGEKLSVAFDILSAIEKTI
ncbi:MAG: bifunctional phosphopantothenoylcysteine decarboxylase/phosphopantothenate--cysteine ligase CoaBC [Helicobacteraceae bacterium]|jgi:phosphopantothenoylcysteine decarboxylase/phosphopantothenate--cysteine ligase|nr:bifunctional phosphopantothenoylcysteine decarboxylase/phosphopantothenate--cysteine ligase CoaBC [Helicobacteraceae bacterium]